MKIEMRAVDSIVPYDKNPRHNDHAVAAVAESLKAFGFRQPIVVDADGVIIVGHTRYKAAQALGLAEVPVHVADLTPEKAKAYRLADNQTATLADWNPELLTLELGELKVLDFDLKLLGFGDAELAMYVGADIGEAAAPSLPEGDRSPFQQMTFTLHDDQAQIVNEALGKAKRAGAGDAINENSNGNALVEVCKCYLG